MCIVLGETNCIIILNSSTGCYKKFNQNKKMKLNSLIPKSTFCPNPIMSKFPLKIWHPCTSCTKIGRWYDMEKKSHFWNWENRTFPDSHDSFNQNLSVLQTLCDLLYNTTACTLCLCRPLERFRVLASGRICGHMRGKRSSSKWILRHKVCMTSWQRDKSLHNICPDILSSLQT